MSESFEATVVSNAVEESSRITLDDGEDPKTYKVPSDKKKYARDYDVGDEVSVTVTNDMIQYIEAKDSSSSQGGSSRSKSSWDLPDDYLDKEKVYELAEKEGIQAIYTSVEGFDPDANRVLVKATVTDPDGNDFSAIGDADPDNADEQNVARTADTRAVLRAIKRSMFIHEVAVSELPPSERKELQGSGS